MSENMVLLLRGKAQLLLTALLCYVSGAVNCSAFAILCRTFKRPRPDSPRRWMAHSKIYMDGWFLVTMSHHVSGCHAA